MINFYLEVFFIFSLLCLIICGSLRCLKAARISSLILPKIEIKDVLIISMLAIPYALFSIYNLGSHQQQSVWFGNLEHKQITINFNQATMVKDLDIYGLSISGKISVFSIDEHNQRILQSSIDTAQAKAPPSVHWMVFSFNPQIRYKAIIIYCDTPVLEIKKIIMRAPNLELLNNFTIDANINNGLDSPAGLFTLSDLTSFPNYWYESMYYDEPFYALIGAASYLHPIQARNPAHPPLGSLFISLGILIFGMNPFGWRIMTWAAGVSLIPIMYVFALYIFRDRKIAIISAFFCVFDFLHFTISRLAFLDNFSQVFTILVYLFLFRYISLRKQYFNLAYRNLIYLSICFGFGVACKWTTVFSLLAILPCFLYCEFSRNNNEKSLTIAIKMIFSIITIPIAIYILSYVPLSISLPRHNLLLDVYNAIKAAYNLHTNLYTQGVPQDGTKTFWQWPLNLVPLVIYSWNNDVSFLGSRIVFMGNPAIWLGGVIALGYLCFELKSKTNKLILFILIGFCAQYLPLIFVQRISFIYYFYSATPFIYLALAYTIKELLKLQQRSINLLIMGYLLMVIIFFVSFYPILSGELVRLDVIEKLSWLPSWKF